MQPHFLYLPYRAHHERAPGHGLQSIYFHVLKPTYIYYNSLLSSFLNPIPLHSMFRPDLIFTTVHQLLFRHVSEFLKIKPFLVVFTAWKAANLLPIAPLSQVMELKVYFVLTHSYQASTKHKLVSNFCFLRILVEANLSLDSEYTRQ